MISNNVSVRSNNVGFRANPNGVKQAVQKYVGAPLKDLPQYMSSEQSQAFKNILLGTLGATAGAVGAKAVSDIKLETDVPDLNNKEIEALMPFACGINNKITMDNIKKLQFYFKRMEISPYDRKIYVEDTTTYLDTGEKGFILRIPENGNHIFIHKYMDDGRIDKIEVFEDSEYKARLRTFGKSVIRKMLVEFTKDGTSAEFKYNRRGIAIQRINRDANGKISGSADFENHEDGSYDAHVTLANGETYVERYDKDKKRTAQIETNADGTSTEIKYDNSGKTIQRINRDANGKISWTVDFEHHEDGSYDAHVTLANGKTYVERYDKKGNKTGYIETNADGTSSEFKYDNSGETIQRINRDANGKISKTVDFENHKDGSYDAHVTLANGETYVDRYDKDGNKIEPKE